MRSNTRTNRRFSGLIIVGADVITVLVANHLELSRVIFGALLLLFQRLLLSFKYGVVLELRLSLGLSGLTAVKVAHRGCGGLLAAAPGTVASRNTGLCADHIVRDRLFLH